MTATVFNNRAECARESMPRTTTERLAALLDVKVHLVRDDGPARGLRESRVEEESDDERRERFQWVQHGGRETRALQHLQLRQTPHCLAHLVSLGHTG